MNALVDEFFGAGNELDLTTIPDYTRAQLNEWIRSLGSADRTSFLPREIDGRLFWYVFTPSDRRANEILELLSAWIGPTYSDVTSNRGRLNLTDPFDSKIAHLADVAVLRFEVLPRNGTAHAPAAKRFVRDALSRLATLLDNRPASEFQLAKSTAQILDDLGHALSARDRGSVDLALASLAANGDLDTLNQSFVRVRALASLEDWDELLEDRSINDLLQVSRPPGVTRAIRRAVFNRYFTTLAVSERDSELLDAARGLPAEYRSVAKGPPANHPDELIFQVLLALTSDPPLPTELVEGMTSSADKLRVGLEPRLSRLISTASKSKDAPLAEISPEAAAFALYAAGDPGSALHAVLELPRTAATVRVAVLAAADIDDKATALIALDYIAADPEIRDEVASSKQIRNAIWALEQTVRSDKPLDWSTWLDQIARGDDVATALDAVPTDYSQWTPMSFAALATQLNEMNDDALMVLGEVSGQFLAAHRDLIEDAGVAGAALGRRLLAALAVSFKSSAGVRAQTLNLVDIAFSASFTPAEYSETVMYINDIRKTNASSGTVEWQADLFQLVTSYPKSNDETGALDNFVAASLEDFIAFRYGLSLVTIRAIRIVCDEYPLDFPPILADLLKDDADESRQYAYLAGKTVGLYSLMESAAGRAAQLLRSLVPSIEVRLFSNKVGSTALAQASASMDIFVIVTAAAKHAATEFIESQRGTAELVRVNAKGTSAIMNALRRST
jgi:hypothetical protein